MTPLAPTTTELGEPVNQTPSPLTRMMTRVDQRNRRAPAARTKVPSRISGMLLL